ncbi:glycoside hydrolase family 130 protein [Flavisphingomonas formosensis]|uniref:glycoside hydrolase family 130 protein n=1 Tax=Flavisphingomonas formosensis TaxID=861534 RepID=UPI0012F8FAE8|nr:glycoside hydrolase family 130 protein [Sphingomonas formosensis]
MADDDILTHAKVVLKPDPSRTVIRPFDLADPAAFADEAHPRAQRIAQRVLELDGDRLESIIAAVMTPMTKRHANAERYFRQRFEEMRPAIWPCEANDRQALLIGAYFSEEYAFEAAALFNPSIILDDDQSGLPPGAVRFLLSLRGIGEGHVSSVTFRRGVWNGDGDVAIEEPSPYGVPLTIEQHDGRTERTTLRMSCMEQRDISEAVLFPVTPSQHQGIEDLRLLRLSEEDGSSCIVGTYTAFSGAEVRQEILRTPDFHSFELVPVQGDMAGYKGMALFPRRIGGRYAALGRQDSENIWLLDSDDLYTWNGGRKIISPRWPWEYVQMGNCGSPIELDEGWLVLTHGVGMVRAYCMGACLLDKDDPSKLLGRTARPLLFPSFADAGGYVPNVVYSCGALVHDRTLLLPYGVGDTVTTFASAPIDHILAAME